MQFPLELRLQPSRILMASVLVAHLAAALALFHVPALTPVGWLGDASVLQTLAGVLAWGLLTASLASALRAERLKRTCRLWLEEDGLVEVFTEGAERGMLCRVRPHSAVMLDWAVWFRLVAIEPAVGPVTRESGDRLPLPPGMMVLASNAQAHDWRYLRAWVRHLADPAAAERDSPP